MLCPVAGRLTPGKAASAHWLSLVYTQIQSGQSRCLKHSSSQAGGPGPFFLSIVIYRSVISLYNILFVCKHYNLEARFGSETDLQLYLSIGWVELRFCKNSLAIVKEARMEREAVSPRSIFGHIRCAHHRSLPRGLFQGKHQYMSG